MTKDSLSGIELLYLQIRILNLFPSAYRSSTKWTPNLKFISDNNHLLCYSIALAAK